MIVITANEKDGQKFVVCFQGKTMEGDKLVWVDKEVNLESSQSQAYGIDENFRLIVEAPASEPPINAGN
ncbi:hypothetical protein [Bradyrhizobium sp. 23AC]